MDNCHPTIIVSAYLYEAPEINLSVGRICVAFCWVFFFASCLCLCHVVISLFSTYEILVYFAYIIKERCSKILIALVEVSCLVSLCLELNNLNFKNNNAKWRFYSSKNLFKSLFMMINIPINILSEMSCNW